MLLWLLLLVKYFSQGLFICSFEVCATCKVKTLRMQDKVAQHCTFLEVFLGFLELTFLWCRENEFYACELHNLLEGNLSKQNCLFSELLSQGIVHKYLLFVSMYILQKPETVMKIAICFGDGLLHCVWNGKAVITRILMWYYYLLKCLSCWNRWELITPILLKILLIGIYSLPAVIQYQWYVMLV